MKDRIVHQRTFKAVDPEDGRRAVVEAKLYSLGGQKPYFSVTSQNGSDHERILRLFPELEDVVALHLSDENGAPMHAEANLRYHLKNADIDAAMRHCRIAKRSDLETLAGRIMFADKQNETAAVDIAVRMKEEVLSVLDQASDKFRMAVRMMNTKLSEQYSGRDELRKLVREIAEGREPAGGAEREFFAKLTPGIATAISAAKIALKKVPGAARAEANMANDPTGEFVAGMRPGWKKQAEAAIAILKDEPVVAADYVEPEADRNTFAGFAKFHGLTMEVGPSRRTTNDQMPKDFVEWPCTIRQPEGRSMFVPFSMHRDREAPDLSTVLECVRSDVAGAANSFEEWCDEFGWDGNANPATALRVYEACVEERRALVALVGEEAVAEFVEKVGEDEPVRSMDDDGEDAPAFGM